MFCGNHLKLLQTKYPGSRGSGRRWSLKSAAKLKVLADDLASSVYWWFFSEFTTNDFSHAYADNKWPELGVCIMEEEIV